MLGGGFHEEDDNENNHNRASYETSALHPPNKLCAK